MEEQLIELITDMIQLKYEECGNKLQAINCVENFVNDAHFKATQRFMIRQLDPRFNGQEEVVEL